MTDWLLLLVCPACRGDLVWTDGAGSDLGCRPCAKRYPVVDGVPWVVADRSRAWRPAR